MTDLPYTEDDLRAEAARQLANNMEDPDYVGVGEQMEGVLIPSTVTDLEDEETEEAWEMGQAWHHLQEEYFNAAQHAVHKLINGAADVSEWAVEIGADRLEPVSERIDLMGADGTVGMRIHFAFSRDVSEEKRREVIDTFAGPEGAPEECQE